MVAIVSDVAFQVRLDSETHRRWRVKAAELGYSSLAELVRGAVEAFPYGGTPTQQNASISASFTGPPPIVEERVAPEVCPKRHVAGVYCKHCGVTP